ncbi:MAG: hypothetical protein NC412_08715 [Roseburia sp.]|nr:hypothetical protein [Roseburia sp.]MCM1279008.1 hypothetical protein [Robinsoniella sp.]
MKSVLKRIIIILVLIFIVIFIYMLFRHFDEGEVLYLETGDDFTKYAAYTLEDEKVNLDYEGINIYFYLSDSCSSCIEMLGLYQQMSNIEFVDGIKFYCLWEDNVPMNKIRKRKIEEKNVLSLHGDIRFQTSKPYFYIVKDGIVDFSTYDYNEVIDRAIFYADKRELKERVFHYLFNDNNKSDNAVMFMLEEQLDFIEQERGRFDEVCIIFSYRDEGNIYDEFELYKKIFEIDFYPSVVFFKEDKIVNEVIENSH